LIGSFGQAFRLFAPAGTPKIIVSKILTDVAAITNDPEFRERYIDSVGYKGVAGSSVNSALLSIEIFRKKEMIEAAGIKPE
jgi:tripartite-type tricarboxylate transporter receptor subunit TctC